MLFDRKGKAFGVDCAQGYHLGKPRGDHPMFSPARAIGDLELPLGAEAALTP